ncbi:MAG TPA: hypothetical protein PKM17_14330 [Syntrophorhabdus sp.]|nr:hypothetical protein [Syntrophorhabdus sp.]
MQEKHITYLPNSKLAIRIINRLNTVAKVHGIDSSATVSGKPKYYAWSFAIFVMPPNDPG